MFNHLKTKYYCYSVWRKISAVWNEYKKISDQPEEARVKLAEFLDSFQKYYMELVQGGYLVEVSLDKIYGDLGDILVEMVEVIERESVKAEYEEDNEFVDRALAVAELIVEDSKYGSIVKDTPGLTKKIIGLLDTIKSPENQQLLLHVISLIGQRPENLIELGTLGGFGKILSLMEDKRISSRVILTFKEFLVEIDVDVEVDNEVKRRVDAGKSPKKPGKLTSVMNEVKNMFLSTSTDNHSKQKLLSAADPGSDSENSFIPVASVLEKAIYDLKESVELPEDLEEFSETKEIEELKRYMTEQGVLTAFTRAILKSTPAVQLDILETVAKLLHKNRTCQAEFIKIDGYSYLVSLFDGVPSTLVEEEAYLFLQQAFKLLYCMIICGHSEKKVGNRNAFQMLFNIVTNPRAQENVRMRALRCLQDVVTSNPLNIAHVYEVDGIARLFAVLESNSGEKHSGRTMALCRYILTLLRYIAVLTSKLNIEVLKTHLSVLRESRYTDVMQYTILTSLFQLLSDHLHRKNPLVVDTHCKEIMVSLLDILSRLISSLKSSPLVPLRVAKPEEPTVTSENTSNPGYNSDSEDLTSESTFGIITTTDYSASNSCNSVPKRDLPSRLLARIPMRSRPSSPVDYQRRLDESPSGSGTSSSNKSQAMLFRQKFICILRSIGMLAYATPTIFHDFFGSRVTTGVPVLTSFIYALSETDYGIPPDVTELALWMIKELIVVDSYHCKRLSDLHHWHLDLLKFEADRNFSETVQIQVCYSAAELIEDLREKETAPSAPENPSQTSTTSAVAIPTATVLSTSGPLSTPTQASTPPLSLSTLALSYAILEHLLVTLQKSKQQTVRDAAWYALGKIINFSENLKQFLRDHVGLSKLTEIMMQSGVVRDRAGFDVMLGFACYGLKDSTGSIGHSQGVQDLCISIKIPQPGVFSRLVQTKTGFTEGGESSMASLYLTSTASVTEDSFSEDDFSELSGDYAPSGFSGKACSPGSLSGLLSPSATSGDFYFTPRGPPQPNFRFMKSRSVDSLVSLFNQTNYPKRLTSDSKYSDLTRVQLRSTEVVPMLFRVLETADVGLQKEVLKLILVLCSSNPANTKVLSRGSGLVRAVNIVKSGNCKPEVQPYYCKLISLLGTYDITGKEVRMLYDIIMGRIEDIKGSKQDQISLQLLYVLANISERYQPLSYLSFSGLSGHFKLGRIDKFPAPKVGYTISFWFKLNAFLQSEQGILSWNNHDNDDSVFELYIKVFPLIRLGGSQRGTPASSPPTSVTNPNKLNNSNRRRRRAIRGSTRIQSSASLDQKCGILCVQTRRNRDSPSEHFSFDGYNFREWGNWHHVVLTHEPKQVVLYVDGEMVQSCSTLNYPLLPSPIDKLTGYVGRRGAKDVHSHSRNNSGSAASANLSESQQRTENTRPLCGQVSTMHFIPGLWTHQQVQTTYQGGLIWDPHPSAFLSIRPEDYIIDAKQRELTAPPHSRLSTGSSGLTASEPSPPPPPGTVAGASMTGTASSASTAGDVVRGPLVGSIQDKSYPPGVVAHATNALQKTLQDVGGVKMPLAIMDKHKAQRNVGLRILGNILRKSPENIAEFSNIGGYSYLYHILHLYSIEITRETFEILVDILCDEDRSQNQAGNEEDEDDEDGKDYDDDEEDDDESKVHEDENDNDNENEDDDDNPNINIEPADQNTLPEEEDEDPEVNKNKNRRRKHKLKNLEVLCLLLDLCKKCCTHLWYDDDFVALEAKEDDSFKDSDDTTSPNGNFETLKVSSSVKQSSSADSKESVTRRKKRMNSHTFRAIRYALRILETLITEERYILSVEEYNNAAQKTTGLLTFLQLYATITITKDIPLRPLKRVLQIFLPYFEHVHMETLVNFLIGSEVSDFIPPNLPKAQLSSMISRFELLKSSALQVLYNQMASSSLTVERLRVYGTGDGGSFRALLTLLKSPEEATRLLALKMIGIFLNGNKTSTAYFNKNSGFDMISLLLAPFPVTLHTLQALLSLSLDEYRCKDTNKTENESFWSISIFSRSDNDGGVPGQAGATNVIAGVGIGSAGTTPTAGNAFPEGFNENSSESKGDAGEVEDEERESQEYFDSEDDIDSVLIIHPEAIHAMFELIKYADNEAALVNVSERLLGNSKNIEIIWKHCCWLDWCLSFLDTDDKLAQDRPSGLTVPRRAASATGNGTEAGNLASSPSSRNRDDSDDSESYEESDSQQHSHNTLRQLGVFIKKMMIYELESSSPRFHLLKELENEQFQGHVVELVIDYFDKKPKLKEERATAIISNLVVLFKHIKGLRVTPRVYVSALDLIAKLTVNNTAEIRSIMHKLSLFELRNELICFLLASSQVNPAGARHLIEHFDFRAIAAHDDFRAAYGIHYLLRLFHETTNEPTYQQAVYKVLRIFGNIESNKIFLKDLLDKDEVFESLFNKSRSAFFRWYFGDTVPVPSAVASTASKAPKAAPIKSPKPKLLPAAPIVVPLVENVLRVEIEDKINKILAPFDQKLKVSLEKIRSDQEARIKKGKLRKQSNTKWQNFALLEQKRKRDENTSRETILKMLDKTKKTHEKTDAQGFELWAKWKESEW